MRTKSFLLSIWLFAASVMVANAGPSGWYNIKDFGAKGDGKTIDTATINAAIEEAVKNGGGTIFFPAGNYLSFSIHLQNNISLYLDPCLLIGYE